MVLGLYESLLKVAFIIYFSFLRVVYWNILFFHVWVFDCRMFRIRVVTVFVSYLFVEIKMALLFQFVFYIEHICKIHHFLMVHIGQQTHMYILWY